jgi:hypothetical protein
MSSGTPAGSQSPGETVESRISQDVALRLRALQALLEDPEGEGLEDDPVRDDTRPATRRPEGTAGKRPGTPS